MPLKALAFVKSSSVSHPVSYNISMMIKMLFSTQLILLIYSSFGQAHSLQPAADISAGVAFTAALTVSPAKADAQGYGIVGPCKTNTTLIHSHVITNIGNAYNPITGVFTAPADGLYYFTFTTYTWWSKVNIGAALYKNQEEIALVWQFQNKGENEDYGTNGATLQLVKGDRVYMVLPAGFRVTGNNKCNICTFTGFLIFLKPNQMESGGTIFPPFEPLPRPF